ncbi:MAG TPA: lamin tail domain-containing protein, partial [Ilumatobacteraceae bacterium]
MGRIRKALVASLLPVSLLAVPVVSPAEVEAVSDGVVISQVYGGGGNAGATFTHDFIELFNRGTTPVSLNGWSVQYTSATGTGNFGSATNLITPLPDVTLQPGQYFLVQESTNAAVGSPLPTPDATDATPIAMAAGAGKVALVNTATALGCNGSSTPCSAGALAQIVDLVGYGSANFFEGAGAAPTISAILAAFRNDGGCTDTDNNAADFVAALPAPRNTSTTVPVCTVTPPTRNLTINDVTMAEGDSGTTSFTFTVSLSIAAGAGGVAFDIATADDSASAGAGDYVANALTGQTIPQGATTSTFTVLVNGDTEAEPNETFFVNVTSATGATVADGEGIGTIVNDDIPVVAIHDIQGAAHRSPLVGQRVTTPPSVVTAVRRGTSGLGFWIQDLAPDGNDATSEGVFVFTNTTPPSVSVGDEVQVTGTVTEFGSSPNLTLTELSSPLVATLSTGNELPAPTVIGAGGRVPPTQVIDDDSATRIDITAGGVFDPAGDGIDFY